MADLNRLYHEHEAARYEITHPEIFEQLPPLWREMVAVAEQELGSEKLRILDVGCGTGFEARQCLASIPSDRVERLVCYDPSEAMLQVCRHSFGSHPIQPEFLADMDALFERGDRFNLLITNSVLHHIVDPVEFMAGVVPLLASNAVWLCGHEPSRRLMINRVCRSAIERFEASDRWRRFLSPKRCVGRILRWVGVVERPEDYAARRAVELSIFERRPPASLISELVDYHVVAGRTQLSAERGLDFRLLEHHFAGTWKVLWRRTYSFLGSHYAGRLPSRYREQERRLAREFPDDGGNICLVWRSLGGEAE